MAKIATPARRSKSADFSPHRIQGGGFLPGLTAETAEYESVNEFNALCTLGLCHDVLQIVGQPPKDRYILNGVTREYTPDFVVTMPDCMMRLEIKSISTFALSESAIDKYLAIAKSYAERGEPFSLLLDVQLEDRPRIDSVSILARRINSELRADTISRAVAELQDGPLRVKQLLEHAGLSLADVWTLIAQRHLCFDWGRALDPSDTEISLPGQPFEGLKLEHILRSTRFGRFVEQMALGGRAPDKRLLAGAQDWRQPSRTPQPWSVVGDCEFGQPLRALESQERLPRNPDMRRSRAPGFGASNPDQHD